MMQSIFCAQKYCELVNKEGRVPFPFDDLLRLIPHVDVMLITFPQDILGSIELQGNEKKIIYLADHLTKEKQDVTLATLLAHVVLHEHMLREMGSMVLSATSIDGQTQMLTQGGVIPIQEQEALVFAFELLMPESLTKKAWSTLASIQGLSQIFRLPISFVAQRLAALGIFS